MHSNVKKIAMIGMLLAIQIILGRFVSITLPVVKLSFMFLPRALTALFFGPLWGAAAAVMGDFLVTILGPYAYFPPMATTALLEGIVYALFLYRRPLTTGRVVACVITESVVCSILLQTYWLTVLTGAGFVELLPVRLLQNAIIIPVQIICIRGVAPMVSTLLERGHLITPRAVVK